MTQWNLSEAHIFEIIHKTLINILSDENKSYHLNKVVELLNKEAIKYKLNDNKKLNSFSKYLKIEHRGILNFIEEYNFYGIIVDNKQRYVTLYKELIKNGDFNYGKRITKDSDWIIIC